MSSGINLQKPRINLNKSNISVDLQKPRSGGFGRIEINLNWSQAPAQPAQRGGFLKALFGGTPKPAGIDLDLGCLYEHVDGRKSVVQALGDSFGDFHSVPYINLSQDDRTGSSTEGEFLYLNGERWPAFKRVLIFAFIYDGVANWAEADGRVVVSVPDQSPIEVLLDEAVPGHSMCAVAMLTNERGAMRATKLGRYFRNHTDMDKAYQWGLRWTPGTKD